MARVVWQLTPMAVADPKDPYANLKGEELAMEEDYQAYLKRAKANARPQCLCGRFAKPGQPMQMDIMGEYNWSVICSKHGEVWLG